LCLFLIHVYMKNPGRHKVHSISEQHRILSLPSPSHPQVTVFNFDDIRYSTDERHSQLVLDLYCVSLKRDVQGKMLYGQGYYDFDEGVMVFTAPNQVVSNVRQEHRPSGWCVAFHPDFIRQYPLGKKIKGYGFFDYSVNEALHLSEKEEEMVIAIIQMMQREIAQPIDAFSQDVVVAHLELLLSYANRFYNRQFITRKDISSTLLTKFEALLSDYFNQAHTETSGPPAVSYFADQLNITPNYLSDMLRNLTGKGTLQHIQDALIEKAKELLSTTELSVSQIAYHFGFEYPQSFNKLFKKKLNLTPLEYRQSFNN